MYNPKVPLPTQNEAYRLSALDRHAILDTIAEYCHHWF
jgi:hypothetical protein